MGRAAGDRLWVDLGLGGDSASPVGVTLASGLLVVGPPGSGRSEVLATVALGLRAIGVRVVVVARDGPLAVVGAVDPHWHAATGPRARTLLGGLGPATADGAPVVVIDDLDVLVRSEPWCDELVAGWVHAAESGDPAVARVVGAARTDRAAGAYRGAVAALRGAAPLVVLSPASSGSADLAGLDLSLAVDPVRPLHPGAGVVVDRGRVTWVRFAGPVPDTAQWALPTLADAADRSCPRRPPTL
ncbi:MAG: eccCa1 2 [Actinotalea sp.]|nr:eccCa1 2 [Actinotalea sp.]